MIAGTVYDHLPPNLARRAARVAGFPPVIVPGVGTWSDRAAWDTVLARATPEEDWRILQALEPALLEATPAGASRLRHARDHGAWRDDPLPLTYGDAELLPLLKQALALMPPAVASNACRLAAWIGISRRTNALTLSAHFAGTDGVQRERLVVVALDRADVITMLHESAHLWHSPRPGHDGTGYAIPIDGGQALRELAREEGWSRKIEREERDQEALAHALALVWAFRAPVGVPA